MGVNYRYLRPAKAEALKQWYNNGFEKRANLKCGCYENATILPLRKTDNDGTMFGLGGVQDEAGTYLPVSGIRMRVGGYYDANPVDFRNERVVYCGYWVKHWGHFLVEAVTRMWYCLENDENVDYFVFVSEENGPTALYGNYKEFFELLGVSDKILVLNKPVRFSHVLVPEIGYDRKFYYTDKYKAIFDRIAKKAAACSRKETRWPERVFLSRSQFAKARQAEAGLDLLDDYFERNGFEVLYPEKMSLTDMVCYLRNAQVCAMESGTLPHNMLFAQDGQKTLIVERQTTINEIQVDVDRIRNLQVTYIDGYYGIYPVRAGYGPYIMAYTQYFERFTVDHSYTEPDSYYRSQTYTRKSLDQYMRVYKNAYGYKWGIEGWQMKYADLFYEAYIDSTKDLEVYLNRTRPFCLGQITEAHFWKQLLKKVLSKIR